ELRIDRSPTSGRVTFVTAADGGAISVQSAFRGQAQPMDFLVEHGYLFGVSDPSEQLSRAGSETDFIGYQRTTYHQVHEGVPVFSGTLKVHQNRAGQISAANGDFYRISPKLRTTPSISSSDAASLAAADLTEGWPTVEKSELVIVDPGWYGDRSIGARLAYHLILSDVPEVIREAFFVDAHTGRIIDRWSMVYTARNRKIHDATAGSDCCYDSGNQGCDSDACEALVCDYKSDCCQDWDGYCAFIASNNCGSLCLPGTEVRGEGDLPILNGGDVNKAYDYYGDTYDYFYRAFGRDSINNGGMTMVATVNSYAPGCPNAYWDGSKMVFCSGMVTDDIVGHELTHGVTQFTAGLIYQNQSGQLNESFSDVFGELVDLFNGDAAFLGTNGVGTNGVAPAWPVHPSGPGRDLPNDPRTTSCSKPNTYRDGFRWLIGEDVVVTSKGKRDMWNPTCFQHPDRTHSEWANCGGGGDNGGVHSGSGVVNHAFALAVDGGTFNGYTFEGIGPIKAGAVWYIALTQYLTSTSEFVDAAVAFQQAAKDLEGTQVNDPRTGELWHLPFTAADTAELVKALKSVELNLAGPCAVVDALDTGPAPICPGGMVIGDAEDFEEPVENKGWVVELSQPYPPTPYQWERWTPLPNGRAGYALYCEDLDNNCSGTDDETAVHSLYSPEIVLPTPVIDPTLLVFDQYFDTELAWDGGLLRIRTKPSSSWSSWEIVDPDAFLHNGYNYPLLTANAGNSNPLAGQWAWSGKSDWGTTVVDLGDWIQDGATIQFRFDFGKGVCNDGNEDGWYIDDFRVVMCDCNTNGIVDSQDIAAGTSEDCNSNGAPDECEIAAGADCNSNGTVDACDIAGATSSDCDSNGKPDTCDVDTDSDGTIDACDGCPSDSLKTAPGQCGCGEVEVSGCGGGGGGSADDQCPNDPDKTQPGVCGCGVADTDDDNDGTPDCNDSCPFDGNKTELGICGCSVPDTDFDQDGTPDCNDECNNDPAKTKRGQCGCGVPDTDTDGDGTPDCIDNTPTGAAEALRVSGPDELLVGQSAKYSAELSYADGTTEDVSAQVSWKIVDIVIRPQQARLATPDTIAEDGTLTVSSARSFETTVSVAATFDDGAAKLQDSLLVDVKLEEPDPGPGISEGDDTATNALPEGEDDPDGDEQDEQESEQPTPGGTGAASPCGIGMVAPMGLSLLLLGFVRMSRGRRRDDR
ncbi:MAG: hypothetical protein GY842_10465, partial [bacterium]|nr:hypothetical protein [bacterium]